MKLEEAVRLSNTKEYAKVYKKWWNGDDLTDKDLELGIYISDLLLSFMNEMGPEFRLFSREVNRFSQDLMRFQSARKEK